MTYDVIVAGLGGMGGAYGFAVRGRRVLGRERYRPILADLAIDGSTRHPIELFSPDTGEPVPTKPNTSPPPGEGSSSPPR